MLLTGSAFADETTPLSYSRGQIAIERASAPLLPWQAPGQKAPPLTFEVEVRDAMTLYNQQGWFNLSGPSPDSGVLLAFGAPTQAPILPSAQYAPLDILLIDKEGKILQIIPNLLLTELEQEIYPAAPVLAFLFLKGGTSERFSIRPGDSVEHKLFRKPPVILSAPPPAAPQNPPTQ
jgi:uncharacterized membrane protein (UPF0127 family)